MRASVQGSSPRVRGSPAAAGAAEEEVGIIPAGAGLTSVCATVLLSTRDHPRGCGAHRVSARSLSLRAGSSPRVRGSLSCSSSLPVAAGIIPAGAGLTERHRVYHHGAEDHPRGCGAHSRGSGRRAAPQDHPRGCGAHSTSKSATRATKGSSPRVRGSRPLHERAHARLGIIPAGAGLTF